MLEDLRTKYQPEADAQRVPLPPLPEGVDIIVSFDQSLTSTGVVTYDGVSTAAWTLRADKETEDLTGYERTFARSVSLQAKVISLLATLASEYRRIAVLHETPAVGKARRPESSILGAHCVRWAVHEVDDHPLWGAEVSLTMVSGQRAKTVVAGNSRADKAEVREALKATYSPEHTGVCTNDHERDALALLVTWIKDN